MSKGLYRAAPGDAQAFLTKALCWEHHTCLVWPYAVVKDNPNIGFRDGTSTLVRRLVCESAHGAPLDPLMKTMTRCGNSRCVSPWCLYWAMPSNINTTLLNRGSVKRGSCAPNAKLDEATVKKIREESASYVHDAELARMYGCSTQNIRAIRLGNRWRTTNAS